MSDFSLYSFNYRLGGLSQAKKIVMDEKNCLGLAHLLEAAARECQRKGRHGRATDLFNSAAQWRANAAERA